MSSADREDRYNAGAWLLARHIREGRGERTAVICGDRVLSYRDIAKGAAAAAGLLREKGVQPEQRVALLLRDSPEFVFWFMGALQVGAVAVPLNTFCGPDLLAFYLENTRAPVLLAHRDDADKVAAARDLETAGYLRDCLWAEDVDYTAGDEHAAYQPVSGDDSALWLYTSGSTGRPKGVVHRHGAFRHCAETYGREVLAIGADDVCFSTSKLFFAYGLGNSITFPFSVGAAAILNPGRPDAAVIAGLIREHRPSLFFSVPALYNMLLESGVVEPGLYESVRLCISAGEYLPEAIFAAWGERAGHAIYDGIGSTEAMHIFCSNTPTACRPGTSGVPVPGYALSIVDDEGIPVAQGQIGNLMVRGESAAKEYWNRSEVTRHTFRGEWLWTGDLFQQDEDGYYRYIGRQGDAFKSSGLWVSPVEIEQTLLGHDAVLEAAVVAGNDAKGLSVPKAFVVPREPREGDGAEAFRDELFDYLNGRLSKYKVPHTLEVMAALPKTATGKVARAELRRMSTG